MDRFISNVAWNQHQMTEAWLRLDKSSFGASQGTVETSAPFPVGNLGEDVVLECRFLTKSGTDRSSDVLITWEKEGLTGLVYQYKNNAAQLQDQNAQFKDRAQLFTDAIAGGNASLLLRSVKMTDGGVYYCNVGAPGVWGRVRINLRVSVYSAPTITKSNNSLRAEAPRWTATPSVTWVDQSGKQLNSSTQFTRFNNSGTEIVQVVSDLPGPLTAAVIYTCFIEDRLIKSVSEVTGDGDLKSSYFVTSSSPKMPPLQLVCTTPLLLYMLAW
ncbi:V-set domain-containing T-cell activation inhibitor 1 isoform X2 [Colossoma macropomum]|uniref:V-set domain-containing T-cell activation inhibitor 1 isoform X2 n=1 Tax=Colossoma macropomum TaxID=42526 RepID=UPI0018649AD1|nr:V-set domain-containing T-cell activation inhibitor 1 isoform X2 [Colossoma macropomum]